MIEKVYSIWLLINACIGVFLIGYGIGLFQSKEIEHNKVKKLKKISVLYCFIAVSCATLWIIWFAISK